MAFADFDLDTSFYATGTFANQPSGNASLNATLANPLTTTGLYNRQFDHSSLVQFGDDASEIKAEISAGIASGGFIDTPSTQAISLRARVRLSHISGIIDTYTNAYCGVMAYAPVGVEFSGGYELVIQQNSTAGVRLAIRARSTLIPGTFNGISQPAIGHQVTCSGTYALDQWYHIRMDIVPNGVNQKTLTAYTSVDDGLTWQQQGQLVATNLDAFWRTTGRSGFISLLSNYNTMHWTNYIDDFEAYIENV